MELKINVQDLSNIVIRSATGESYRLVREEDLENYSKQINELIDKSNQRFVSQKDLLQLFGIGHTRLKTWVAEGLSEIHDGNRVYYDLQEVNNFLEDKKI